MFAIHILLFSAFVSAEDAERNASVSVYPYCTPSGPVLSVVYKNIGENELRVRSGLMPWVGMGQLRLESMRQEVIIKNWVDVSSAGNVITLMPGESLSGDIHVWSFIEPVEARGELPVRWEHRGYPRDDGVVVLDLDECPATQVRLIMPKRGEY